MRKKRLISHLISLGFVVGVAGFAYYDFIQSNRSEQKALKSSYLLNQELEFSKLHKIEIKKSYSIILEKENDNWILKTPLKDEASFAEVARWFDEIKNQKVKLIERQGDIPWGDYYLENSPQVILNFLERDPVQFFVSSKASFDGKFFLKKGDKLYIGEQYFAQEVVDKTAAHFRNKKIIPTYGHPNQVTLDQKSKMNFFWKDYKWSFQDKNIPLDTKRLDRFWQDLSSLESSSFKGRATSQALKKYKLNQPQDQIILKYNPDKRVVIKMSSVQKDKVFVHSSHRNFILEISKKDRDKLFLSPKDIYDYTKFFNFNTEEVAYLKFQSSKRSYTLEKKGREWVFSNSLNREVDPEKVKILLNSVSHLKGQDYKKSSLQNKKDYLIIKNSAGKDLLKMDISSPVGSFVWVQTQLFKGQVALSHKALDFLHKAHVFSFKNR